MQTLSAIEGLTTTAAMRARRERSVRMTWEDLITQTGRRLVGDGTSLPGPRQQEAQPPGPEHTWFRDALQMQLVTSTPPPRGSPRTVPSEDEEQRALFHWRDHVGLPQEPLLAMLFHTNVRPQHSKRAGGKLKALGVKKDMPDLFLSVARHGFHGLWIELKALDGTVSSTQKALHAQLRDQGYCVVVAWGWIEAAREPCQYLSRADLVRQLGGTIQPSMTAP